MIEKFAITVGQVSSEFLDLNHTSKAMLLVSLGTLGDFRYAGRRPGEVPCIIES